jgi:UDP-N-acetylglucosamine:LPS N-acetylglucosamine transferase
LRVLILSAPVGAGHNAAAAALAAELEAQGHGVEIVDGLALLGIERLVVSGYRFQILNLPWSWRLLYRASRLRAAIWFASGILGRCAHRLERLIAASEPDVIVSTYPLVSAALAGLRRRSRLAHPTATLVTDFDPHPGWVHRVLDQNLLVGDPYPGTSCIRPPVAEPVSMNSDASQIWEELGLSPVLRTALIVGGAWGVGNLGGAAEAVLAAHGTQVIVVAGYNEPLRRSLEQTLDPARAAVLGFTDRMHDLMRATDVLIQNAGGMTCLEAFAHGLPVIMFDPLPGHGEDNSRRMTRAGVVVTARSSRDLTELVASPDYWAGDAIGTARAASARFFRPGAVDLLVAGSVIRPRQPSRRRRAAPIAIVAVALACWFAAENPPSDADFRYLVITPHAPLVAPTSASSP